ncbi:hypothetical protein K435DRAFT_676624, partial [Dendrothele bispora CBS 962.96]
ELPPFIKSIKEGWHSSLQAAAVVVSLYLILSFSLNTHVDMDAFDDMESSAKTIVLIVSYGGIIFNYSATIGALCLSDRVASFPLLAKFRPFNEHELQPQLGPRPISTVLEQVNAGRIFTFLYVHFMISLFLGILCNFFQVLIFIGLIETRVILVVMTIAVAFSLLSLSYFVIWC